MMMTRYLRQNLGFLWTLWRHISEMTEEAMRSFKESKDWQWFHQRVKHSQTYEVSWINNRILRNLYRGFCLGYLLLLFFFLLKLYFTWNVLHCFIYSKYGWFIYNESIIYKKRINNAVLLTYSSENPENNNCSRSFRNHSNMLVCCSIIIATPFNTGSRYYKCYESHIFISNSCAAWNICGNQYISFRIIWWIQKNRIYLR